MHFHKYDALGNDYIVVDASDGGQCPTEAEIGRICDRHHGVGSDGLLFGPIGGEGGSFELRIFNPDGTEAEKSGNGLRIFARYLWDTEKVTDTAFEVVTKGGAVLCEVREGGRSITVHMGKVSFKSPDIPVTGEAREVLDEEITVAGKSFRFCAATIGNPHCIILCDDLSAADACKYGPPIESDARFANRTNVQFMKVLDQGRIRIEIWERGAGYTLASGTSASAAAAVAHRLGLCDGNITVVMQGGELEISVGEDYSITMTGPAVRVFSGDWPDQPT